LDQKSKMPSAKNVMIIGASAVGKSCIFLNATQENFVFQEVMQATIAVTKPVVKPCKLKDGSAMKLKVWDCGGQERFKTITEAFLKDAAGCIIVYSVDNVESLECAKRWLAGIVAGMKEGIKTTHVVIAANKTDLPDSLTKIKDWQEQNQVLAKMAADGNIIPVFGVSAKTNINIEELFTGMAELIKAADNEKAQSSSAAQPTAPDQAPGTDCCVLL